MIKDMIKAMALVLLLMFAAPCISFAQSGKDDAGNTVEAEAYREDVERNMQLKERLMVLKSANDRLAKEVKRAQAEYNALVKDSVGIEKYLGGLRQRQAKSGLSELLVSEKQLAADNESMRHKIDTLRKEIAELDVKLSALGAQQARLETVKTEVGMRLINDNRPYLEQPFSKMTLNRLEEMRAECAKYTVDGQVTKFVAFIDSTIKSKTAYDKAVETLSNRFDKLRVQNSIAELRSIGGLDAERQKEVDSALRSLSVYEEGVITLREFVTKFVKERERGMSAVQDCKDAVSYILSHDGMEGRISAKIVPVKYLNRQYSEYRKAIMKNFKTPTAIEREILGE